MSSERDLNLLETESTGRTKDNWVVYKHISPSGKVYIGITSNKPERRWNNGKNYKDNTYFKHAIGKYGWGNFQHIIVCSGLSEWEAKIAEVSLIKLYKLRGISYNISNGGDGNSKEVSEETRRKISIAMKGHNSYNRDDTWRRNKSEFMKNNPIFTEKIREKAHNKCAEILSIPVEQYDMNNKLLNTFSSIREASRITAISSSLIVRACKGGYFNISRNKFVHMRQAKGYKWKYKDNAIC